MPTVAEGHAVPHFEWVPVGALDRDAARHPERAGDGYRLT